jgi:hypothetical protein
MGALFAVRAVDMPAGYADPGVCQVSVGKTLPQGATQNLFTVVGTIVCDLRGVVSTIFGASTKLSIGVTGTPGAIAAAPAAGTTGAVGSVIVPPQNLGGLLPAYVSATGIKASCFMMEISNTIITCTADTSTTGAVTWILNWAPLQGSAAVATGTTVTTN